MFGNRSTKIMSTYYENEDKMLHYYECKNNLPPLVFIHAQGVDGLSFENTFKKLSTKYHIYAIDCYGHGKSLHNKALYNLKDISEAIIEFIQNVVKDKVVLVGHSSGGLIAAYIASNTDLCAKLVLEDPPFFASQGERRKRTFNYIDLSTICHHYIAQDEEKDFVIYYFKNQYAWNFFPDKSREKVKGKLVDMAQSYRKKHPEKNLKVPFWPKYALSGFRGMNNYDPYFGETFYNDSFHAGIQHDEILKNIKCETLFMKAKTNVSEDGILMAALNEDDVIKVSQLIQNCRVVHFDCGHGIHVERKKEFIHCLLNL